MPKPLTLTGFKLAAERERARHERAMDKLTERLEQYQQRCSHSHARYVSDASGNGDSYYECEACGLQT